MLTLKADLGQWRNLVGDVERLDRRLGVEVNAAMGEAARLVRDDVIRHYQSTRIGSRRMPAVDQGMWARGLQIQTRGTGFTLGQMYVQIVQTVPYARQLEDGQAVSKADQKELTAWARRKFGMNAQLAQKTARAIVKKGRTEPEPVFGTYVFSPRVRSKIDVAFASAVRRAVSDR